MKNNIYLKSVLCILMSGWFSLGQLQAQITCSAPGSSANIILSEDFSANAPFGWTQDAGDDFDWITTQTGPTTTGATGPDAAHSGPHYAYIETSLTFNGDTANLISPSVDLLRCSNTDAELTFYYHMFGADINLLEVDISVGSTLGPWINAPIIPAALSGQQQTAGPDPWRLARVDLSAFVGSIIYFRFQGVAGAGFEGDIAIDLVQVEACSPCETPQGFHAYNVLDTQVDLFWTHPAGTCTNTVVEYGPPGFVPGGGTSVVLPCPASVPYTLTGLTAGTTYDIYVRHQCGATFSCNAGTAITTFATCAQAPAPSAGIITANMVSPPVNPYTLCFEDTIRMNSTGFVPPAVASNPPDPTGLGFAIYACPPTSTNPNPNTDSCYTGYWFVTDNFLTVNNAANVYDFIIANPAGAAQPSGVPTNRTLYFIPTTMDDAIAGGSAFGYDLDGDNCGDRGAPVEVVFLEQITFSSSTLTCTPPNTLNNPIVITIAGGLPGFNPGSNYTATSVGDGTMTVSGSQNETLTFTGLAVGDQIQVNIVDGQGCTGVYDSGVLACPGGPIVQIAGCGPNLQTDACAGSCITLNTLVRGGAIGSPAITTLNSAPAGLANGQNGIMFDLEATTDIIVNTIAIDLDAATVNVNVYLKCGTLAGSESTPGDWQLAGSAAIVAVQGINTIPLDLNLAMCAGSRYAVYIQTDGQINYQTGSNQLGAVITSDANFNIFGGLGVELSFGALFGNSAVAPTEGRLFRGDINYSTTGYSYAWDNGATGDACAICPIANGLHTLTVTGSTGAVTTETFNVTNIINEAADDAFHSAEGTQSDGAASSCLNPVSAAGAYVVNTICSGSTGSTLRPGGSTPTGGVGPAPWAVTCTGGPIPLNDNPVFMTIQCAGNGTMAIDVSNPGGGAVSNVYGALVGPITCPNTIADLGSATAVDCDQNATAFTLTAPSVTAGQLYALIINTTGQGNVNINVAGTAFPIELNNLTATRVGQTSQVSWTTLSETQNDRFEIERSTNGTDFLYIGSVKGSGSTTLSTDYEFVDRSPRNGVNFYRLNQIDIDGSSHHSNVVSVTFTVDNFDVEVYPNPFSEVLNFSIMATDATPATILLYDLAGKQVWDHSCELVAGGNLLELTTHENTPAGTYLLVVKYQGKAKTFKVFKE